MLEYKKRPQYKIGSIMTVGSAVWMFAEFIMMYFNVSGSVLRFFVLCPVLVIGSMMMTSARLRYEREEREEPSRWEIFIDGTISFKDKLLKRGVLGAVLTVLLAVCFVGSAVMGIRAADTAYQKSGAYNAGYKSNLREYQRYKLLRDEAVLEGNEKRVGLYEESMEHYIKESEWYLERSKVLAAELENRLDQLYIVLSVNAVMLVVYIVFCILKKPEKKS